MSKPVLLMIDDRPDEWRSLLEASQLDDRFDLRVIDPEAVSSSDMSDATLCLVDYDLDDWVHSSAVPARSPLNGVALISVLRWHALQGHQPVQPTTFAVLTGKPNDVAPEIKVARTPYTASRLHGFEWMFAKDEPKLAESIASLADATTSLRSLESNQGELAPEDLLAWLCAPSDDDGSYSIGTARDLDRSRPPLDDLFDESHRLAVLRWLLHRVLPYPGMLIGDIELAARLELTVDEWRSSDAKNDDLKRSLQPFIYSGPAAGIVGRRWWSSGIDRFLYSQTDGSSTSRKAIRTAVAMLRSEVAPEVNDDRSVPVVDPATFIIASLAPQEECVAIHPDDWPATADTAWALREDVADGKIPLRLVQFDDRDTVDESK